MPFKLFCLLQTDPDNKKDVKFDWWSKYYASIKDEKRTQREYVDEGHDMMTVINYLTTPTN